MDVESLYTNMKLDLILETVKEAFLENPNPSVQMKPSSNYYHSPYIITISNLTPNSIYNFAA